MGKHFLQHQNSSKRVLSPGLFQWSSLQWHHVGSNPGRAGHGVEKGQQEQAGASWAGVIVWKTHLSCIFQKRFQCVIYQGASGLCNRALLDSHWLVWKLHVKYLTDQFKSLIFHYYHLGPTSSYCRIHKVQIAMSCNVHTWWLTFLMKSNLRKPNKMFVSISLIHISFDYLPDCWLVFSLFLCSIHTKDK